MDYSDEELFEDVPQLSQAIEDVEMEEQELPTGKHVDAGMPNFQLPASHEEALECYSGRDLSTVLNTIVGFFREHPDVRPSTKGELLEWIQEKNFHTLPRKYNPSQVFQVFVKTGVVEYLDQDEDQDHQHGSTAGGKELIAEEHTDAGAEDEDEKNDDDEEEEAILLHLEQLHEKNGDFLTFLSRAPLSPDTLVLFRLLAKHLTELCPSAASERGAGTSLGRSQEILATRQKLPSVAAFKREITPLCQLTIRVDPSHIVEDLESTKVIKLDWVDENDDDDDAEPGEAPMDTPVIFDESTISGTTALWKKMIYWIILFIFVVPNLPRLARLFLP